MFGSIQTYLNAVSRTWHGTDGTLVAQLVSLRDRHATNPQLQVEFPESLVERILDAPIDEILVEHIKVLYYLSRSRKCFEMPKPNEVFYFEVKLIKTCFSIHSKKLYGSIQTSNGVCTKRSKNATGNERGELVIARNVHRMLGSTAVGTKM